MHFDDPAHLAAATNVRYLGIFRRLIPGPNQSIAGFFKHFDGFVRSYVLAGEIKGC